MTTKAQYLRDILGMRLEWSAGDQASANQLAGLRYTLERARKAAEKAPATVPTAAGGVKPNPVHAQAARLADQEARLTRRLDLGMQRTAGGQYEAAASPAEARRKLWEAEAGNCNENLVPGLWVHLVSVGKCSVPGDWDGWPNNPQTLPETDKAHAVGSDYVVSPGR